MNRRSVLALLLAAAFNSAAAQQRPIIPEDVRANVRARVDAGWAPSVVMGVVDDGGTTFFAYGRTAVEGGAPVDERTMYEIGSITKVFTAIVLAQMSIAGEIGLDDPVQQYLPESVRVPASGSYRSSAAPPDPPITLRLLSAQRSGLARMPSNFAPRDPANPYADYDSVRLYDYLRTAYLDRAPGSGYQYSNLGVGLLGHVLALRSGLRYEDLVRQRILTPLGMTRTMVTFTSEAWSRLALGSADGRTVENWDLAVLAGAGALRSTAEDMTRFVAAAIGLTSSPLDSAFRLAATPLFDAGSQTMRIGLGWHIRERNGSQIVWHNGGTGGYHSFAGYDPAQRRGVVVLTNSGEAIEDLGYHALDTLTPLVPIRRPVALPVGTLSEYVGSYPINTTLVLNVTQDGDHLAVQGTGQQRARLWASAPDEFFLRVVNAQISFTRGTDGRVDGLVLHQNGREQRAERSR